MHHKYQAYCFQSLTAAGFVILDPAIAFKLRPDLFSGHQDARLIFHLGEIERELRGLGLIFVLADDSLAVATRSLDILESRIEWQTGIRIERVDVVKSFITRPDPEAMPTPREKEAAFDSSRLRVLAKQQLPEHDCAQRRAILEAREQLGVVL